MKSVAAQRTLEVNRGFGKIKWFGGINKNTGRENHFGFIESINGNDIYMHKTEWRGESPPSEGELVTFIETEVKGKSNASHVEKWKNAKTNALDLYLILNAQIFKKDTLTGKEFIKIAKDRLNNCLVHSEPEDLHNIIQISQQKGSISIFLLASEGVNAVENYSLLLKTADLLITDDAPWAGLTNELSSYYEKEIVEQLAMLEPSVIQARCLTHLSVLPTPILVLLLTKGIFTKIEQLGSYVIKRIYNYASSTIVLKTITPPGYLRDCFDVNTAKRIEKDFNPIFRDIIDNLWFKKSLFDKNTDFIEIYNASTRLQRNIETFILYHLVSLFLAGNSNEIVYSVFLQRLWSSLISKELPLDNQTTRLKTLFPQCTSMTPLSCEAVYWSKNNMFLCRGKTCNNPRILPNPENHFLNFSIYDWLNHYGVSYMFIHKPSNNDFPIKLASYFNRLREIFPVLHCRVCGDLMLPNMKYARTQYKEIVNGVVDFKEMAAAYRLTVFHCNNSDCTEFEVGNYISHCIGFGCFSIIDSRDLKQKCSHDRYICKGCGSCCSAHKQSNPVGLCPSCGEELEVWNEKVSGHQTTYLHYFAKCKSCACTITSNGLNSKFRHLLSKNNPENCD